MMPQIHLVPKNIKCHIFNDETMPSKTAITFARLEGIINVGSGGLLVLFPSFASKVLHSPNIDEHVAGKLELNLRP